VGRVVDPTAWVAGNYTVEFTTATDWQVVDDATPTPNVIATGTGFAAGQSISFNGITVRITGTPAATDTFEIQPAQDMDMFAMLEELAVTLESSGPTAAAGADFSNRIGEAIANIDQALERTIGVRAEVAIALVAQDIDLHAQCIYPNLQAAAQVFQTHGVA
jgi:flagellar hook-associated protein 3 FlgL